MEIKLKEIIDFEVIASIKNDVTQCTEDLERYAKNRLNQLLNKYPQLDMDVTTVYDNFYVIPRGSKDIQNAGCRIKFYLYPLNLDKTLPEVNSKDFAEVVVESSQDRRTYTIPVPEQL